MPKNILQDDEFISLADKGENGISRFMFDITNALFFNHTIDLNEKITLFDTVFRPLYQLRYSTDNAKTNNDLVYSFLNRNYRLLGLHGDNPAYKDFLEESLVTCANLLESELGRGLHTPELHSEAVIKSLDLL